ncbi:MAG: heme ABC transporter ATP-binding protein [Myxococcales bacterium]
MLRAHEVTWITNGRKLVDGATLTFAAGQLHLIVGPNGAGKSTLLKLLSGELRPQSGAIAYGAAALGSLAPRHLATIRAILSQNLQLAFPLRVREVVMMGRYPHLLGEPSAEDERICSEALRLFDVAAMEQRDFSTLSGGEQQRVHFARVLAQIWVPTPGRPRYLFLDEPLTFLDIFHQVEFMRTLQALTRREELVVVGVVHDLNLASRFGDQLVLLHEGKVLAAGPREQVLTREKVERAFRLAPTIVRSGGGHPYLLFE